MTAMAMGWHRMARASPPQERADVERRLALLEEALGVSKRTAQMPIELENLDRMLIDARLQYLEHVLAVQQRRRDES